MRTANAIERRFREVRRGTRPMGVFQDGTSMDRILFAVFTYESSNRGVPTLFSLTRRRADRPPHRVRGDGERNVADAEVP